MWGYEVQSVRHITVDSTPHVRLLNPVEVAMALVLDTDTEKHYYRAEVMQITRHKMYYIGIGNTEEQAMSGLFRSLARGVDSLRVALDEPTFGPAARITLRERLDILERYVVPSD